MEPVIRAGETYTLPRDMSREDALEHWFEASHDVYVLDSEEGILGTYFLQPNHSGGGSHVSNCSFVTAQWASGRGIARFMCEHAIKLAKERKFAAMQFNFVISTNERAVHLWQSVGFEIVGRLPGAFLHPTQGYVDALVMYLKFQ